MSSPAFELQRAIVARLKDVSAVTAIIGDRVFDHVPRVSNGDVTAEFPYVNLGSADELTDDADCVDGLEITMQIDCWSREVGFPEVKTLAGAVRDALHDYDFSMADNALVYFRHRLTRFMRDPDGLTSHAAMMFEAFVEQP